MTDNEQSRAEPRKEQEISNSDRPSKLSPDEIDALLQRSALGVRELRATLEQVFRLPRSRTSMRLR